MALASAICGGEAERQELRRREQWKYEHKYGSPLEQVRCAIDFDAVNRMRVEKGDAQVIRVVRRQLPDVPFKEVVQLVREL